MMLSSCGLFRSATVEVRIDQSAEQKIEQGKRLMQAQRYEEAMDAFAGAADRSWHRGTTVATYMTGLAAHYAGYDDVARARFKVILDDYPRSRYAQDARYHLALGKLDGRSRRRQMEGAIEMLGLLESTNNDRLRKDALSQFQAFLFRSEKLTDQEFQNLYENAVNGLDVKVLEPWLYRKIREGKVKPAQQQYQSHRSAGGARSDFLEQLFSQVQEDTAAPPFEPGILRLAISMPFYWNDTRSIYNQELPSRGVTSLEFYEGFKLAVEEYSDSTDKQVFLRIYDSRRDTTQVRDFLQQMEAYRPTLLVGDYFNRESAVIATWADSNRVPQIIPYSPTAELVEGRDFTFLAHPAVFSHGARMAEHAWYNAGLTRVAVFSDSTSSTAELAEGFITTFVDLGGRIDTMAISSDYEEAVKQIPRLVRQVVEDGSGVGVYIPLMGNEEATGLIINLLRQRDRDVVVMGSPHFRTRYNTLSRDIKERYRVLFSTSHLHDSDSELYRHLYREYLKAFNFPPSENVVQGYDLARFLLSVLDTYDPSMGVTLDNYLRIAPEFKGLHINYNFDSKQSNQEVNIGQYTGEGVTKVNP